MRCGGWIAVMSIYDFVPLTSGKRRQWKSLSNNCSREAGNEPSISRND
jgi:hypothetical protein